MKIKMTIILFLIGISSLTLANPNAVISLHPHYDKNNKFVTPDKILLAKGINSYKDGYNQSAFMKFKQASAFGNTDAQFFLGLMHIKSLGVKQDWAKGYAWIKLASLDKTKKHVEYRDAVFAQLKPEEIKQAKVEYKELLKDYDLSQTLKRRNRWVKKQLLKTTGSRVGSQTANVQSQAINGVKIDNNRTGRLNEMQAFVDDYNFGIVNVGEIKVVDKK